MKDVLFRNIETGEIISTYESAKSLYLQLWQESKRNGEIPEDSADYEKPILSSRKDLIESAVLEFEMSEEYERITHKKGGLKRASKWRADTGNCC